MSFSRYTNVPTVWVGGSQAGREPGEGWEWVDGAPVDSWTSWAAGQPDDDQAYGGEDCLAVRGENSSWYDVACYIPLQYICSRSGPGINMIKQK